MNTKQKTICFMIFLATAMLIMQVKVAMAVAPHYVKDPSTCPQTDPVVFPGQNCNPIWICGNNLGIAQCYDTPTITMPSTYNPSYQSQVASGLGAGYVLDCYNPLTCVDSFWCSTNSSCNTWHRTTMCNSTTVTECDGCMTNYFDCDLDPDDCEVHQGDVCYIGTLPGTYDGCDCIIGRQHFITGLNAQYSSNLSAGESLLWGTEWGEAMLMNLTSMNTSSHIYINSSACIIFNDSSFLCNASLSGSGGGTGFIWINGSDGIYINSSYNPNIDMLGNNITNVTNLNSFQDIFIQSGSGNIVGYSTYIRSGPGVHGVSGSGNIYLDANTTPDGITHEVGNIIFTGILKPDTNNFWDIGEPSYSLRDIYIQGNLDDGGSNRCTVAQACNISTGGTPGGSDTSVQYNNNGTFGGDLNFVWDYVSRVLGITGRQTITSNDTASGIAGLRINRTSTNTSSLNILYGIYSSTTGGRNNYGLYQTATGGYDSYGGWYETNNATDHNYGIVAVGNGMNHSYDSIGGVFSAMDAITAGNTGVSASASGMYSPANVGVSTRASEGTNNIGTESGATGGTTSTGGYFRAESATTGIGVYATSSGNTNNYALLTDYGNIGFQAIPSNYLFELGPGDMNFQNANSVIRFMGDNGSEGSVIYRTPTGMEWRNINDTGVGQDHATLSNLAWSVANHTIDTDFDIGSNNFITELDYQLNSGVGVFSGLGSEAVVSNYDLLVGKGAEYTEIGVTNGLTMDPYLMVGKHTESATSYDEIQFTHNFIPDQDSAYDIGAKDDGNRGPRLINNMYIAGYFSDDSGNSLTVSQGSIAYQRAILATTRNCPAGQVVQNVTENGTGIYTQCTTATITETDPVYTAQNATIARAGTATCSGTNVVQNATINSSGIFTNCIAQTGTGGSSLWTNDSTWLFPISTVPQQINVTQIRTPIINSTTTLNIYVNSSTPRQTINGDGIVDFQNQSRFNVYLNATDYRVGRTWVNIPFDVKDFDSQVEYNATTGNATILRTGYYQVDGAALFDCGASGIYYNICIARNGFCNYLVQGESLVNGEASLVITKVIYATAGEKISIMTQVPNPGGSVCVLASKWQYGNHNGVWTWFSMHKLS